MEDRRLGLLGKAPAAPQQCDPGDHVASSPLKVSDTMALRLGWWNTPIWETLPYRILHQDQHSHLLFCDLGNTAAIDKIENSELRKKLFLPSMGIYIWGMQCPPKLGYFSQFGFNLHPTFVSSFEPQKSTLLFYFFLDLLERSRML